MNWSSLILKLAAAGAFGGAVAMLALVAYRLTHGRTGLRQRSLRESELYRLLLPVISSLAGTVNRLGLEPLRQYLHEPYAKAGYPGGLDDDEVVAVGLLMGVIFSGLIAFLAGALL